MPQYGQYKPDNSENLSTLFSYQEVPLTSTKLNRWNGNISVGFELLHSVCAVLLAKGQAGVLTSVSPDSLRVRAQAAPDLTVLAMPGWASLGDSFAGLRRSLSAPVGGSILPPLSMPRIDLVLLNVFGEIIVLSGTESLIPQSPATPVDTIALAQLYLRPGMVRILEEDDGEQGYIIDARQSFLIGDSHRHAEDHAPQEPPDGSRTSFHTRHFYREGTLDIYLNGVLQERGFDYMETGNHRGYTFFLAPKNRSRLQHRYVIDHEYPD